MKWKQIPGFPFEISTAGLIRRCVATDRHPVGFIYSPQIRHGRPQYTISHNGERLFRSVGSLVEDAFGKKRVFTEKWAHVVRALAARRNLAELGHKSRTNIGLKGQHIPWNLKHDPYPMLKTPCGTRGTDPTFNPFPGPAGDVLARWAPAS